MEVELINLGVSFAFGCVGAGSYAVLGYLNQMAKNKELKKKDIVPFDLQHFGITTVLGGFAGVALISFGMDVGSVEHLLTMAGAGATAKKVVGIISKLM
uniref:Uncharacterized protein n=1 Tax=viral metagenome TaxID=1070528 RepID=A0A6M3M782_9ZZZZ